MASDRRIPFFTARPGAIFVAISLLVFFISLIPRFVLIDAWLPHYFIDENDIVEHSIAYLGGDLEPDMYGYGPLYAYLLTFVETIGCKISHRSYPECAIGIFFEPTRFYVAARIANVVIHLGAAFITFLIARSVFGMRVALVALTLLVFPFADLLVHFSVRVDSLLALLVSLTLFAVINAYQDLKVRWYILAGVGFGLCVATKPLPALLILPTLGLAHLLIHLRKMQNENANANEPTLSIGRSLTKLVGASVTSLYIWLFVATAFLAHLVVNPYSMLNIKLFYWAQIGAFSGEHDRHSQRGYDISAFFDVFGSLFTILACISVLYMLLICVYRRNVSVAILTSYPIVFYLAFATGSSRDYWYVPIIFLLTTFISKLIVDVSEKLASYKIVPSKNIVIMLLIALILIQPATILVEDVLSRFEGVESHSGLLGKRWIEGNIESGSSLLFYGSPLFLPRVVDQRAESQAVFGQYFMRINKDYYLDLFKTAHKNYLAAENPVYLIKNINSNCTDPARLVRDIKDNQYDFLVTYCDIKEQIDGRGNLLIHFPQKTREYGFELWIYDIAKRQ